MKRIHKLLVVFLALSVLVALACTWAMSELKSPVLHAQADTYIEIPRGSSQAQIVSRLTSVGIVKRGWLLSLYVRLTGAGPKLKAGEYRFPSPISPLEVLKKLEFGEQRLSRLTIVEGWTRFDIAELLARVPELRLSGPSEALALMDDTSAIRDIDPEAKNLEGFLFPDTYSFSPETPSKEVIATMVRRFRQVWDNVKANQTGTIGSAPKDLVTIASLIETEAKLKEERPLVASVIYNRLRLGMPLGIDSSVVYASKLAGKWRNDGKVYLSDLERQSPYNTRKVRGLPPGPIASPGADSLKAAANPANTDYLYYVREPSRDDGAHNFYNNESDFQRGVQALRSWESTQNLNPTPTPAVMESPFPAP